MPKGKLRPEDEYKIRFNYPYLTKEVIVDDDMLSCAFAEELIDIDDKKEIRNIIRETKKTEKFIDMVFDSGKEGYAKFVKCLEKDHHHVVEELNNTPPRKQPSDPYEWFNGVDDRIKSLTITDADATRFSFCLGNGWEHLMMQLGFGQPEIEMEKDNERKLSVRIAHLLCRWRQKRPKEATVKSLVDNLKVIDGYVTIDREKLQEYVQSMKVKN